MAYRYACGLAFVAAAWSFAAQAQAQIQSPAPAQTIIVTGQLEEGLPQDLAKVGVRVDTVTAADIKNGGFLDIAQSLQSTVPGLYISPRNGPFSYTDISSQGSRTSDVLWLVDGIRINNRLYAGTDPLDTLPSAMVERIEVLEGGQALFYGTQAPAGAVNIVTKSFSGTPDGSLTFGGDTNDGKHIDGNFRDGFGKHEFVLYGSHDESSGYKPFPDADFQPSGTDRDRSYDVTTLGGKFAYNFDDALRFTAGYQHTDAKVGFAQAFLTATAFNQRKEDLLTSKIDYTPSQSIQLFVKGYYHWWKSHYTEFDNDLASPGTLDVIDDHDFWGFEDYGLNLLTKLAINRGFEYFAGYDFQNYNGRDDVLVIKQQTEHVHAFFGQIRTTPDLISFARFAAGLRYNAPSVGKSAVVWNVSGQVDLSDNLFLKASAGTAFRLPTAEELFADDPNDERGNPNLKPERSTNLNASVGGKIALGAARVNWEVIGFGRDIKNLIDYDTFDSLTNQDVFGNVAGTVKVRGGEFILDVPVTDEFTADFSYTHNHARQSGSSLAFARIPVDLIKASLDYHPAHLPFGLNATLNHVGDVFDNVGGVGRVAYGNYAVVDLSARLFLDRERHHRLDGHIDNLFDKAYSTHLSHGVTDVGSTDYTVHNLGLPRTFVVSYTYSFR